jgi:putative hydrolase of the HAD superfamily
MNVYKHLFFDLDHTLWDFETNAKLALQDIYIKEKLHQIGIANFDDFFTKYSFYNEKLWDRYTKGFIKQDELRWKRIWLTLLDYKIANEVLAKQLSTAFLEILPTKTTLFSHTIELLEYLKLKDYTLHLITNGFESVQQAKLKHSKLSQYFTHVVTSEGSNAIKPQKEIFEYALSKAQTTNKHSIMIGDNIEADILGAVGAGFSTIYVNHINKNVLPEATHTVFNLEQIMQIL